MTNLATWFLNTLTRWDRKRIILDRESNEPYLERYYLFLKDRQRFPFNIFIHKFLKSDPGDPHDHPWPYATLILAGGYREWQPIFDSQGIKIGEKAYWRGPGHFRICGADSYHRIELVEGITPWTLFMPGPHRREWGFLVGDADSQHWVHNEEYLSSKAQS
jgi:hypothetical protein